MPNSVDLHVGAQIGNRRREAQLSETDLAQKAQIELSDLKAIEKGMLRADAKTLLAIASALNAPLSRFFEGLDPDKRRTDKGGAG